MFGRTKVAALVAEFLGTFVLASAVLAMVTRTDFAFFPAFVAGLVLMVVVLVFGPVSGAHINPAVTIALWTQRKVQTTEALVYVAAQMLGGVVAFRLGQWLLEPKLQEGLLPNLAGTVAVDWRIITAEVIGTFVFATGIAATVARGYEGAKQAVAIGFSLTLGILVASLGSNGVLNPAVAVGINSFNVSYAVAPIVGAVLGMALYNYLFVPAKATRKVSKKRK